MVHSFEIDVRLVGLERLPILDRAHDLEVAPALVLTAFIQIQPNV